MMSARHPSLETTSASNLLGELKEDVVRLVFTTNINNILRLERKINWPLLYCEIALLQKYLLAVYPAFTESVAL